MWTIISSAIKPINNAYEIPHQIYKLRAYINVHHLIPNALVIWTIAVQMIESGFLTRKDVVLYKNNKCSTLLLSFSVDRM